MQLMMALANTNCAIRRQSLVTHTPRDSTGTVILLLR